LNAILGTAGHIDHGKSELVRALTGIHTDRLPEEQRRGISIELGFAWMDLPEGGKAGIVDVPGHERFIRHMLAGAHGFDVVVMVVAADDGVMPQTEEHFEIVNLLGVERLVFVVTKTDLASAARVEEVREELEILALDTRYEGAPVAAVCARSGEGIEELRSLLIAELGAAQRVRPADEPFRMPIDRVFSVRGHGSVVTGTALSGHIEVGASVQIEPSGLSARVRELQVHSESAAEAGRGQRVALNLVGPNREDLRRGDLVVAGGEFEKVECLYASVEVRPIARDPLASHRFVRLHLHTRDVRARLIWLEGLREVPPRGRGFAQLIPVEPVIAQRGDRFVLRDETASHTLGGGCVLLAPAPRRRGREGHGVSALLEALADGDAGARLYALLQLSEDDLLPTSYAASAAGVDVSALKGIVDDHPDLTLLAIADGERFLTTRVAMDELKKSIVEAIATFHQGHPDRPGVELESLRKSLPSEPQSGLFRTVLDALTAGGDFERRGNLVMRAGHTASLEGSDEVLARSLSELLAEGGVTPPLLRDASATLGVDLKKATTLASVLVERGELVRIDADLYYRFEILKELEARLRQALSGQAEITAAEFRDLISASRKYCIPLLDYFDRCGVTIRVGDARKLRGPIA
jgi:selenocysteine-specific elongation factor